MDQINDLCPVVCRQQQIELLSSLLGIEEGVAIPSLFIYGHTATGKSATVKYVVRRHGSVSINCVECFSSRIIFESVLSQLAGQNDSTTLINEVSATRFRCDTFNDFVRLLQHVFLEKKFANKSVYIILERAERLREMDSTLLPSFLRLQELTNLNLGVILESEIVWEKFRTGTGFPDPYVIHFPNYNKDELLEIIALDAPKTVSTDVYRNYANLLLSVFHVVCRSLSELRHLAAINFATYMEPVNKGDGNDFSQIKEITLSRYLHYLHVLCSNLATLEDTHKLWRNLEPHLKKALQTVYLHEISGARWEQMHEAGSELSLSASIISSRAHVELPVYSKYLVIAAYIASYNPPKTDKRFFSKNAGKLSKRAKTMKNKNERKCCHLLGPKMFPLHRLMAIFYAIVDAVPVTTNVYSQVTSLVTLGLITRTNASDLLETPKFKCLVSLDFVKSIARSVNFEVSRYLSDFI